MDLNGKILNQVTIISATVGKNPLEEMESPHSQQKSLKCSTWMQSQKWQNNLFVSKANHSISQKYKSMPLPVMLKQLKLNSFMKTYKTF